MSRNNLLGWAFVFPAVILITAFLIYPTIRTIQLSFDTGLGFTTSEYVGLENYSNLFTRDQFFFDIDQFPPRGAVFNTIIWLGLFTVGTVGIGLVVAVLANAVRYEVLIKTIIFIPMAISFTAAGIIWRFVYSPDEKTGILNAILVGLIPSTDPNSVVRAHRHRQCRADHRGYLDLDGFLHGDPVGGAQGTAAGSDGSGARRRCEFVADLLAYYHPDAAADDLRDYDHHDHQCAEGLRYCLHHDSGWTARREPHHWLYDVLGDVSERQTGVWGSSRGDHAAADAAVRHHQYSPLPQRGAGYMTAITTANQSRRSTSLDCACLPGG